MGSSNELALETWINNVNQGRCHTDIEGNALGALVSREFAKWVITVGLEGGQTKCRIYKNGEELKTRIQWAVRALREMLPVAQTPEPVTLDSCCVL